MHGSIGNLVELLNKCINGGKYRGISRAYGIPYRRFTYRGIPFIPVYRATLVQTELWCCNERDCPAPCCYYEKQLIDDV
jgi:hypothetical protein